VEGAEAASVLEVPAEFEVRRERGLWSDAFYRLTRNRLAMVAMVLLVVITIVTVLGNYTHVVQRYRPSEQNYDVLNQAPSMDHFFGLMETIEILADPKAMRSLRRSLKQAQRGEWISHDKVFGKAAR